jgi:plastocyanin
MMLAAVAFTGLGGCTQGGLSLYGGGGTDVIPPPPEEAVTDVAIQNIAFTPKVVTIKVGERVRWTNLETQPIIHTTTSGDPADGNAGDVWDSGDLSPGESFVRQFDDVGEFEYYCIHHYLTYTAARHAMVIVEP